MKGADPGPIRARIPFGARIETERLVLRSLRARDVRALRTFQLENAQHLAPWTPWPRPGEDPNSLVTISTRIAGLRKDWTEDRAYAFGVFLDDDSLVGRVTLNQVVRGVFQNAYLGYLVSASTQGKGLAREAVAAVCEFAFRAVKLHRLQAAIMPHNARSIRLAEALGFRPEGLARDYLMIDGGWRDHQLYAVTHDEWSLHADGGVRLIGVAKPSAIPASAGTATR